MTGPMFTAPVSSRRILASRETLAAGLATRYSGMHPVPPGQPSGDGITVDMTDLPAGISVGIRESTPAIVTPLDPDDLPSLHRTALAAAWADGAWELQVEFHPQLADLELGLVTAWTDWSACPPHVQRWILDAAERGLLATWYWRPMRAGPAIRMAAHHAKDASLRPDGGRDGDPPATLREPDWRKRNAWSWTVRLGTWSEAHRPKSRPPYSPPATPRQRAYIAALHHAAGRRPDIPARLTLREASAMIDELRGDDGQA